MSTFNDKVVIITGASSGIGAGTAKHFATLGAKLSLAGRNKENLEKTVKDCCDLGLPAENVFITVGDLSKDEDVISLMNRTIEHYGQLHVLVNNAGIVVVGSVETTSMEDYDKQMNINSRSYFHLTKLAVPHLKKTKGTIVNVSSVNGIRSFPNMVSYCMAKAATDQLTRCAALDLATYGIRVNSVNPGVIVTEIHKRGGMNEEQYAAFLERTKTTHALGRYGDVSEVAKTIAFLASDDASFITGASVPIDGGRHAMCPR